MSDARWRAGRVGLTMALSVVMASIVPSMVGAQTAVVRGVDALSLAQVDDGHWGQSLDRWGSAFALDLMAASAEPVAAGRGAVAAHTPATAEDIALELLATHDATKAPALTELQLGDGSWNGDARTTALALLGLSRAGIDLDGDPALAFLSAALPSIESDELRGLVLFGLRTAGALIGADPDVAAFLAAQRPDGSWSGSAHATSFAVLSLSGFSEAAGAVERGVGYLAATATSIGWGERADEPATALTTALVGLAARAVEPGGATELAAVGSLATMRDGDAAWMKPGSVVASTADVVIALRSSARAAAAAGRAASWLAAQTFDGSFDRARALDAIARSGGATGSLVADLRARQDASGGWAAATAHATDVVTTSAALLGLASAGVDGNDQAVTAGVADLITRQREDGSFALGPIDASSVIATARAAEALTRWREVAGATVALNSALDALAARKNIDGGFGDPGQDSDTLATAASDYVLTSNNRRTGVGDGTFAFLVSRQEEDGSWGHPATTAEVVRALSLSSEQPNLAVLPGEVGATPTTVAVDGTTDVFATLRNLGGTDVHDVIVKVFDDTYDPVNALGEDSFDVIPAGGAAFVTYSYVANLGRGSRSIRVQVSAPGVTELDDTDNSATYALDVRLPAPADLFALSSSQALELHWSAVPQPDILGYEVRRADLSTPVSGLDPIVALTITDDGLGVGLVDGQSYAYTVAAVDLDGTVGFPATLVGVPGEADPGVDLALFAAEVGIVPSTPVEGDDVAVSLVVRNIGGDEYTGADVVVRGYVGVSQFAETTVPLGRVAATTLTWVGASAGPHSIRLEVDPDGLVGDDPINNEVTLPTLMVAALPDLVVSDIRVDPASPRDGELFTVQATVTNQGEAVSGPFEVQLTRDDDALGAPIPLPSIGATPIVVQRTRLQLEAGTYSIGATVDPGDDVVEASNTNNDATPVELVVRQGINLVAVSLTVGDVAGPEVELRGVVRYDADQSESAVAFGVNVRDEDDVVAAWSVSGLQPGAEAEPGPTLYIPPAGSSRLLTMAVNESPGPGETTFDDNFAVAVIPGTTGVDLMVALLRAIPTPVYLGDSTQLSVVVLNAGLDPAPSRTLDFMDDGQVLESVTVPALASGEQTTVTTLNPWVPDYGGPHALSASLHTDPADPSGNDTIELPVTVRFHPDIDNRPGLMVSTIRPRDGEPVQLRARFLVHGDIPLDDVRAQFYDGDPAAGGVAIGGERSVALVREVTNASFLVSTEVEWDTTGRAGDRVIALDAYALTSAEVDYDNNVATRALTVQPPRSLRRLEGTIRANPPLAQQGESVLFEVELDNTGDFTLSGDVELHVRDDVGAVVATYAASYGPIEDGDRDTVVGIGPWVPAVNGGYRVSLGTLDAGVELTAAVLDLAIGPFVVGTLDVTPMMAPAGSPEVQAVATLAAANSLAPAGRHDEIVDAVQAALEWSWPELEVAMSSDSCHACHTYGFVPAAYGVAQSLGIDTLAGVDDASALPQLQLNRLLSWARAASDPSADYQWGRGHSLSPWTIATVSYVGGLIDRHESTLNPYIERALNYLTLPEAYVDYGDEIAYWDPGIGDTVEAPYERIVSTTARAVAALAWGRRELGRDDFAPFIERAGRWCMNVVVTDVGDKAFVVYGLDAAIGAADDPALISGMMARRDQLVAEVMSAQHPDGYWGPDMYRAIYTATVLFTLADRVDENNVANFQVATDWLLDEQDPLGFWMPAMSPPPAGFEPVDDTLWAVMALRRMDVALGGVRASLVVELWPSVERVSSPLPPTEADPITGRYTWTVDVDGTTALEIATRLKLIDLELDEVRPIATEARIEYTNPFTGETVSGDLAIPSVTGVGPASVAVDVGAASYPAGATVPIAVTVANVSSRLLDVAGRVDVVDGDGAVAATVATWPIGRLDAAPLAQWSYLVETSTVELPPGLVEVAASVDFTTQLERLGVAAPYTFAPQHVRVVAVGPGGVEQPLPAWFIPGPGYDAATAAAGTVVWRLDGSQGATGGYRIYFDIEENGPKPGAPEPPPLRDLVVVSDDLTDIWATPLASDSGFGAVARVSQLSRNADYCREIAVGDIDRDGLLDVVGGSRDAAGGAAAVILGRTDGTFGTATYYPPLINDLWFGRFLGDFDQDGDLDVVAARWSVNTALVFRNDGGSLIHVGDLAWTLRGAAVDGDGDGDLDLIGSNASAVWFMRGLPGLDFAEKVNVAPLTSTVWASAVADFDNDGHVDIIARTNLGAYFVRWQGPDPDPGNPPDAPLYDPPVLLDNLTVTITDTGDSVPGIAAIDYDRDGLTDIVYLNNDDRPSELYVARGDGDGTFADPVLLVASGVHRIGSYPVEVGLATPTYLRVTASVGDARPMPSNERVYTFDWPSGTTFPAGYQARAVLIEQGVDVAAANDDFELTAAPELSAGIATERTTYGANQDVLVPSFVDNTSTSTPLADLVVTVTIERAGQVLATFPRTLGSLLPGERRTLGDLWSTGREVPGTYTARIVAGAGLAEQVVTFEVEASSSDGRALVGTLAADPRQVAQPEVNLAWTATNVGNVELTDVTFSVFVITDPDVPTTSTPFETEQSLLTMTSPDDFAFDDHNFAVAGLTAGFYLAVLEATYAGVTQELGRVVFEVVDGEPPTVTLITPATASMCASDSFDLVIEAEDEVTSVAAAYYRIVGEVDWSPMTNQGGGPPAVFDATVDVTSIPDGSYTVEVAAVDANGNDGRDSGAGGASFQLEVLHAQVSVFDGPEPFACDVIRYTPLDLTIDIDGGGSPAEYAVELNGTPIPDWDQGISIEDSGDYTLEVSALDPDSCFETTTCGPFRVQIVRVDAWLLSAFPRVLIYDSRFFAPPFMGDALDAAGIYYREASNLTQFKEMYRSGAYDVVILRTTPGLDRARELHSQVFKDQGLMAFRLGWMSVMGLDDLLGVTDYPSYLPGTMGGSYWLDTNPSPFTGSEHLLAQGTTEVLLRSTAQVFARLDDLSVPIDPAPCQGTIAVRYELTATIDPSATIDIEVSDRFGVVDVEVWDLGATGDDNPGDRANLAIIAVTLDSVEFELQSPDGYRLEDSYDVSIVVTDGGGPTVHAATLPSSCGTAPGPVPGATTFAVQQTTEISVYGDDPPQPEVFVGALHRYGLGKTVTIGFDLEEIGGARFEQLIADAVNWLAPSGGGALGGWQVVPVEVEVENESPWPTDAEVVVDFLSGASFVESVDVPHAVTPLTYRWTLPADPDPDATRTATYLMRLPAGSPAGQGGPSAVASHQLSASDDGVSYLPVTAEVVHCTTVNDRHEQAELVKSTLTALIQAASGGDIAYLTQAHTLVTASQTSTATTRAEIEDEVIEAMLIDALDELDMVVSVDVGIVSVELGELIRMWQFHWYETP